MSIKKSCISYNWNVFFITTLSLMEKLSCNTQDYYPFSIFLGCQILNYIFGGQWILMICLDINRTLYKLNFY